MGMKYSTLCLATAAENAIVVSDGKSTRKRTHPFVLPIWQSPGQVVYSEWNLGQLRGKCARKTAMNNWSGRDHRFQRHQWQCYILLWCPHPWLQNAARCRKWLPELVIWHGPTVTLPKTTVFQMEWKCEPQDCTKKSWQSSTLLLVQINVDRLSAPKFTELWQLQNACSLMWSQRSMLCAAAEAPRYAQSDPEVFKCVMVHDWPECSFCRKMMPLNNWCVQICCTCNCSVTVEWQLGVLITSVVWPKEESHSGRWEKDIEKKKQILIR